MHCPRTSKHLRTRFGILATRLESTDGWIRDHANLSCLSSCARLVADSCLVRSCWMISHSSSMGFQVRTVPWPFLRSPKSAAGFLATTAGLWRSDYSLVPRLEWIRSLTFQPPAVGSEQSRPWAICSSLEGMILPRCSPHNSWCPPLSWVDDVQLTEYLM